MALHRPQGCGVCGGDALAHGFQTWALSPCELLEHESLERLHPHGCPLMIHEFDNVSYGAVAYANAFAQYHGKLAPPIHRHV